MSSEPSVFSPRRATRSDASLALDSVRHDGSDLSARDADRGTRSGDGRWFVLGVGLLLTPVLTLTSRWTQITAVQAAGSVPVGRIRVCGL